MKQSLIPKHHHSEDQASELGFSALVLGPMDDFALFVVLAQPVIDFQVLVC